MRSQASEPPASVSRLNEWFNTNCFVQPSAFTFGDVSRTLPLAVQFRGEIFNLFNTPQFGYPGMTVGTPQFGVVSSQLNQPRLVQFGLKFMF